MKLPDLSYMATVGEMRYIQSRFESGAMRNPDDAVRELLSTWQRADASIRGRLLLGRMRRDPFYPYLAARTRYYDEVFSAAISRPVECIFNIGCGTDTRAHRFAARLASARISVFECDQPAAIGAKRAIASRKFDTSHISYVPIDINDPDWPAFAKAIGSRREVPSLVMLEGVSPYIETERFNAFLAYLHASTAPGSLLAYDFKIPGVAGSFGTSARTREPFRLYGEPPGVARFHESLGYELQEIVTSTELCDRYGVTGHGTPFAEDCLARLVRR